MKQPKPSNQDLRAPEKRLQKYILLTFLKEGYLFFSNLYGLIVHPGLTVNKIKRQKDYSQGILIFGLPIYLWLGWVFILLVSRIFFFQRLQFGFYAKLSFLLSSLFVSLIFSYLAYWVFRMTRKGGR